MNTGSTITVKSDEQGFVPFTYDPDDMVVAHHVDQVHWERASIPPVNAWAERLDAAASSREESYARRGLKKVHFGVGDSNTGVKRDDIVRGLDLLVTESKRHSGTTFSLTTGDSARLADYIEGFPGGSLDVMETWARGIPNQDFLTRLQKGKLSKPERAGLASHLGTFSNTSLESIREWASQKPAELVKLLKLLTPDVGFPYGKMVGWGPALEAHKKFFQRHAGVEARDHFCMTSGDRNAFFNATQAMRPHMVKSGRPKFLLVIPSWGTFAVIIEMFYGAENLVVLECPNGVPDAEAIDAALAADPLIGCVIMCNPNNPTGEVLGSERLVQIAQVMYKHRVQGIFDELYMLFVYEGMHRSMARAVGELWKQEKHHHAGAWAANNIIVIGVGIQKEEGSGKRCSAAWIPNDNLRSRMVASIGACTGQPAILSQAISAAVITSGSYEEGYSEMRFRRNDMLMMLGTLQQDLSRTPFKVSHSTARGGFYVAGYIEGVVGMKYRNSLNGEIVIQSSEDMAEWLVDQAAVIGGPASTALIKKPAFIRLSYGNVQRPLIPVAGKQIAQALRQLARDNGHAIAA